MMYFDKGYTDLAVVYGPHRRWVQQDYADLQRHFPEALLGYNVLLVSPASLVSLHGRTFSKVILVGDPSYTDESFARLNIGMMRADFPHVEKWNLNPGRGPVGRIG